MNLKNQNKTLLSRRQLFSCLIVFFSFLLLVGFQNCSKVVFSSSSVADAIFKSENGGGYSGLQPGSFFKLTPGFTCEKNESAEAAIQISSSTAELIENRELKCTQNRTVLDPQLIDWSVFQKDVIGYKEGIYEGQSEAPQRIPAKLVEVWCRDTKDETGIETLTYYDRTSRLAVNRTFYAIKNSSGSFTQRSSPDVPVSRSIDNKTIRIKNDSGFELTVHRDQPSTQLGLFRGQLKTQIEGQSVSRETSCRLGGTVGPSVWPAKKIVNYPVSSFAFSNDFSNFAFSSYTNGFPLVYTGASDGSSLKLFNSPLGTQEGNSMFSFSADNKSIIYELDENQMAVNLVLAPLDGGSLIHFNPPSRSRMNVRVLSSMKNKIIFEWGISSPTNPLEIYSINPDGSELKKITPNFPQNESLMQIDSQFQSHESDYIITTVGVSDFTMKQYAIAVDGSGYFDLPRTSIWMLFKNFAVSGGSSEIKVIDLKTKNTWTIANQFTSWMGAKYSNSIIGTRLQVNGNSSQMLAISLDTGLETALCPELKSSKNHIEELENGQFLILNYEPSSQILNVFKTSDLPGSPCLKVNSAVTTNSKLESIQKVSLAPDRQRILVQMFGAGGPASQLIYIPLNGQPSAIVDTPVFSTAFIFQASFLSDSNSVIYMGNQLDPSENNVFLWAVPSAPQ